MHSVASLRAQEHRATPSNRRSIQKRTLSDVRLPKRRSLDSYFRRDGQDVPTHLEAIYELLGIRRFPYADFSESGYQTRASRAKHRPGTFKKFDKDGTAKVMTVGAWKERWSSSGEGVPDPTQCRTYSLPQFYAMKLGLGYAPENDPGGWYVSPGTYNALAALLLLRVGAVAPPELGAHAVDPLQGLADAVFAGVKAGEFRVEAAFGLARLLEVLCALQCAHTWLTNAGVQPVPLATGFVRALQYECASPEMRDELEMRCKRYAMNIADRGDLKRAHGLPWLDDKTYPTTKRRQGQRLLGMDFACYWEKELSENRWYALIQLAERVKLIKRIGRADHSCDDQEDEYRGRPATLWSLASADVLSESGVRRAS